VRRLRQASAVMLGKLNLHEFGYGGSGMLGHFGAAKNPRGKGSALNCGIS